MLLIKTKVQPTQIKGAELGLFTLVDIAKGDKYWVRYEKFDKVISVEELNSYEPIVKKYVINYGFQETETRWYLCGDNARFTNDEECPNTAQYFDEDRKLQYCYALRDIKAGEEILCDYKDLCLTMKDGPPWRK